MKKYIDMYKKNYERESVICVLKLITTPNCVREIKFNTRPKFSKNSVLSRINQDRYYFSQIYEIRITFSSSFRDMTYDHYLKQKLPMCEVKLNQILAKNPRLVYHLIKFSGNPYTRKNTNQEIIFVKGRN